MVYIMFPKPHPISSTFLAAIYILIGPLGLHKNLTNKMNQKDVLPEYAK